MTGHEHPNVTLMREAFDAMDRGDMGWLSDHISDDIVWHVGGNSRVAGEYKGREQVAQMMGGYSGEGSDIDTHDILANDDHAVALGTARLVAPDGDRVEYRYVNVFHIRDGKVAEAWGMSENDAETDPFFDKLAPS